MQTWVLDVVIILLIVWFLVKRMMPAKGVKTISTTDLKGILKDKDKQFVDVRTPGEYRANHIREFKNIPLNTLGQNAKTFSKDKEIVVICQSGMRSSQASRQLKKMGFEKVINVRGGMSSWS
jgi:rhodanese-related sulfurtransferase